MNSQAAMQTGNLYLNEKINYIPCHLNKISIHQSYLYQALLFSF